MDEPLNKPSIELDLGAGREPLPGHVAVDLRRTAETDVLASAADLPFGDATVDRIHANSLIPHLEDYTEAFEEWSRVLKPGGELEIAATHAHSTGIIQDADHSSWSWTSETPGYFDSDHTFSYYTNVSLDLVSCEVKGWARPGWTWLKPWSWIFGKVVKSVHPMTSDELMKLPFTGGRVRAVYRKHE